MYSTLVRLEQSQAKSNSTVNNTVQQAIASIYQGPKVSWVLDLDKEGYPIETVIKAYLPEISADVVNGITTGDEVGTDTGYGRPRYLSANRVNAIALSLQTLPAQPLPAADPTGYTPDPRLATHPQLQTLNKNLSSIGVSLRDPEEIAALQHMLTATIEFYTQAQQQTQGMLLFTR